LDCGQETTGESRIVEDHLSLALEQADFAGPEVFHVGQQWLCEGYGTGVTGDGRRFGLDGGRIRNGCRNQPREPGECSDQGYGCPRDGSTTEKDAPTVATSPPSGPFGLNSTRIRTHLLLRSASPTRGSVHSSQQDDNLFFHSEFHGHANGRLTGGQGTARRISTRWRAGQVTVAIMAGTIVTDNRFTDGHHPNGMRAVIREVLGRFGVQISPSVRRLSPVLPTTRAVNCQNGPWAHGG
jgi:hypothetical protein